MEFPSLRIGELELKIIICRYTTDYYPIDTSAL